MFIQEVELLTNCLDETRKFYTNVLQMPVTGETSNSVSFKAGHSMLTFRFDDRAKALYHFAFNLPSNKFDEAYAWVSQRLPILPFTPLTKIADFSNWNAHAFYFYDNQHNILEFIVRHDLPNHVNEAFSPSLVSGICEIGIPVDNVPEACEEFNRDYNIPYFKKGPRLKDFAAMGDENGLFIVTKTGRGWLPTQEPAQQHFTRVKFMNEGVTSELLLG